MVNVSVIVAVRNGEKSLFRCVSSLVEQTMEEIEILLVDAASEDDSRGLMAEYESQFPERIRCAYLPSGGLAEARNLGLSLAAGEYVAFVEATDYVEPDFCEITYLAAKGADLCGSDYWAKDTEVAVDYGEGNALDEDRKVRLTARGGLFFSRIYNRNFLQKNDLKFPENNSFSDIYFNFMAVLLAKTCVKAPGKFYHQEPGPFKGNAYERLAIPGMILHGARDRGVYEENKALVDYKYIAMQMGNVRNVCLGPISGDKAQLERIAAEIRRDCPDYRQGKYFKQTLWQMRAYLGLTMKSPGLACAVRKVDWAVELIAAVRSKLGMV